MDDESKGLGADDIKKRIRFGQDIPPEHYYGDIVRKLFILSAIIMLGTLPFFANLLPAPFFSTIIVVLIIGVVAGLTNPRQLGIAVISVIIAILAFATFEYYAVISYLQYSLSGLFWTNQILAIIFFIALYYSSKTVRGMMIKKKIKNSN
jgi:hypothetical protein